MTNFQLDTSGSVMQSGAGGNYPYPVRWPDLIPFCQGALEAALLAGSGEAESPALFSLRHATKLKRRQDLFVQCGFRHLAPATLARFIADCERASALSDFGQDDPHEAGREFHMRRQDGAIEGFPPLILYLVDDGLIHAREAA